MEVILLERIDKLGQMGDVVNVKSGYARSFLLPRKKALYATEENRRHFEEQRTQLEADDLKHRGEAGKVANKMDGLSVVLIRQAGEAGQLYGSVNSRDIANEVTQAGFTVAKSQIRLRHPIKSLGVFQVKVDLHSEISADISVNVAKSEDEANIQAKTGKAVVSAEEKAEEAAPADKKAKIEKAVEKAEKAAEEITHDEAEKIFENPDEEIDKLAEEAHHTDEKAAKDKGEASPDEDKHQKDGDKDGDKGGEESAAEEDKAK